MKNSEEAIERVLAGLRDAEAPEGMERRILAGLEGRAAARSGWRVASMWLAMPPGRFTARGLACGVALAGVVVLALAIPAMRRAGRVPEHSKIDGAHVKAVPMTPSVIATGDGKRSSPVPGVGSSVRLGTMTKVTEAESVSAGDSAADSDDSVAMSEMQAPSFPAPPMPLTEQERLLLRIARKVDPVEMAMLDPKVRALQDAEEKAEFQRFFGQTARQPLPAQLPPGQSATEQSPQGPTTAGQGVPNPTTTEQLAPEQPSLDQPTQDQPTPEQSKPRNVGPDQSTTQ
jgi:hypothetical protein